MDRNKSLRIPTLRKYWQVAAVNLISAWLGDNPAFSMYIVTASKAAGCLGDAFSGIFAAQVLKTLLKEYHHTSTTSIPTKGFPVSKGLGPRRLEAMNLLDVKICQPIDAMKSQASQALLFRSLPKSSP